MTMRPWNCEMGRTRNEPSPLTLEPLPRKKARFQPTASNAYDLLVGTNRYFRSLIEITEVGKHTRSLHERQFLKNLEFGGYNYDHDLDHGKSRMISFSRKVIISNTIKIPNTSLQIIK